MSERDRVETRLRRLLATELAALKTYSIAFERLGRSEVRELRPIYRQHRAVTKSLRHALGRRAQGVEQETPETAWAKLPRRETLLNLTYGPRALLQLLRRGEARTLNVLADCLRDDMPRRVRGFVRRRVLPRLRENVKIVDSRLGAQAWARPSL